MSKPLLTLLAAVALAATAVPALAENTPQQNKMATCNKEAGDMKGDERKAFMKDCLSKKESQQDRMKRCNTEAQGKTGDDRKAFMSSCLSGKS